MRPHILLIGSRDDLGFCEYPLRVEGWMADFHEGIDQRSLDAAMTSDIAVLAPVGEGEDMGEAVERLRRVASADHLAILVLGTRDGGDGPPRFSSADRMLTLSCSADELMVHMRQMLGRVRPEFAAEKYAFEDLEMDIRSRRVWRGGKVIPLSPSDFELLRLLLSQPECVLSRDDLVRRLKGRHDACLQRAIDAHVRRIRAALNWGGRPDLIRTVRRCGYALSAAHSA